jgi:hypothetical protein
MTSSATLGHRHRRRTGIEPPAGSRDIAYGARARRMEHECGLTKARASQSACGGFMTGENRSMPGADIRCAAQRPEASRSGPSHCPLALRRRWSPGCAAVRSAERTRAISLILLALVMSRIGQRLADRFQEPASSTLWRSHAFDAVRKTRVQQEFLNPWMGRSTV